MATERFQGGRLLPYLYLRWWDATRDNWRFKSLRHGDKDRATEQAVAMSAELRDSREFGGHLHVKSSKALPPHLYFILNRVTGLVKIGITDDVPKRKAMLERVGGVPLELLGVVLDGGTQERALHARFAHLRRLGEWFEATPEILAALDAYLRRSA